MWRPESFNQEVSAVAQKITHARLRELIHYDPETGAFRRKVRKSDLRGKVVSRERLREILEYDPVSGVFVWKVKTAKKIAVGSEAGVIKPVGSGVYRYIAIDGERYLAHRLAWLYVYGEWPNLLRFKDENSLNCAIDNLDDVGAVIGTAKTDKGYVYIRVDGEDYIAARLAWFWVHGEWPGSVVRFRDANPENLRLSNIRDSHSEPAYSQTDQGRYNAQRSRYERTRDRNRDLHLQAKFGITLGKYLEMSSAQDHACGICGQPETITRNGKERWLAVDHCHTTGAVRGLLCGNCNPMIGYAKDNIEVLEKAIAYLKSHQDIEPMAMYAMSEVNGPCASGAAARVLIGE
jgi:hypothetical protein